MHNCPGALVQVKFGLSESLIPPFEIVINKKYIDTDDLN